MKYFPSNHPYGINFGISLSVWDYIFKTAHMPYDAENLELGYPGDEEMPGTFARQAVFGFRKKRFNTKSDSASIENLEKDFSDA